MFSTADHTDITDNAGIFHLRCKAEALYLFCKEGWIKSVLGEYHSQKQALSRYFIGGTILTDPVLQVIRRELRRLFPDVRIEVEEIKAVLTSDVMKRDVVEGEKADEARKKISRSVNKVLREKAAKKDAATPTPEPTDDTSENEDNPPQSDVEDSPID